MSDRPRIDSLFAAGLQGLLLDEPIPPRLVLVGPNGSGKTARLRALDYAVRGPSTKDGLAPFCGSGATVGFRTTSGLVVTRTTTVRPGAEPGTISVENRQAVDPSMGEKTAEAVAERIRRDLAPNVVALSLDDLFGLSGKERRRALLDALGAGSGIDALTAMARLDSKFGGVDPDTGGPTNVVWGGVKQAVARQGVRGGDAIAFLTLVENAAKAQASQARTEKAAAEGIARTSTPEAPVGNAEEVARELEGVRSRIEGLVGAEQSAGVRKASRERIVMNRTAAFDLLPEEVRKAYPDPEAEKIAVAARDKAKAEVGSARELRDKAYATLNAKGKAAEEARGELAQAEGRRNALRTLAESAGDDCPVCGTKDVGTHKLAAEVKKAGGAVGRATTKASVATVAAEHAEEEATQSDTIVLGAENLLKLREEDLLILEGVRLRDRELAELDGAADSSTDAELLRTSRDQARELEERGRAIAKSEGEQKARADAVKKAENADRKRRDAEALQFDAGPSGMQGELLSSTVGALTATMNEVWETTRLPGRLAWMLADPRGNPDAQLVLIDGAEGTRPVPLSSLSGGEQAYAVGALVTALARARPSDSTILLLEGGELDVKRLTTLMRTIGGVEELATAVVTTPLPRTLLEGLLPSPWEARFLATR